MSKKTMHRPMTPEEKFPPRTLTWKEAFAEAFTVAKENLIQAQAMLDTLEALVDHLTARHPPAQARQPKTPAAAGRSSRRATPRSAKRPRPKSR